ncbi:MAG: DUF2849 domain-containing protein [Geminicoccaceae bacterium]
MAKVQGPRVVTANDLLEGDVVYLDLDGGWTRRLENAAIATTAEEAERLLKIAEAQPDRVVGPYWAEVRLTGGTAPKPVHYREAIRTRGPSIRRDLGRQADPRFQEQ